MQRTNREYVVLRDMDRAPGNKFFVYLAGQTLGAHVDWVFKLKSLRQTEVQSPEESDYILLFCPIVSRVGTDISEALENAPGGKKIVLIVMQHNYSPNYNMADSKGQAGDRRVLLVVDSLFHEGRLLNSRANDQAWSEIQAFFGVSAEVSCYRRGINWIKRNRWLFGGICVVIGIVVILAIVLPSKSHKQE